MTLERKERHRAERHELILKTACDLAEAEGWTAVTTRRLAQLIDYSQPVLYSHFKGKAELVTAVATRGFEELAARMKAAAEIEDDRDALYRVSAAYLDFGYSRPVIYEAMFVLPTKIEFATSETPSSARAAFAELVAALRCHSDQQEVVAEVHWSALHGLVVLAQSNRIPAAGSTARLDTLVRRFS